MRVALIGTGTMGAGMARSMVREGLDVVAWNRTRERAEALSGDGIEVAGDVRSAVSGADAVVTMLYGLDSVLDATGEIVDALGPDAVWLQSATVGLDGIRRVADAAKGAALLDAPMLGTKKPAEDGKLVPIVSGDPGLVERARPVLDAVGAKTVVAGEQVGQASALKLACNAWIFSITAATAQSVALAERLGLDGSLFLQAIEGGAADSPYAQLKGAAMLKDDWTPSFAIDGGRKDQELIADAMRSVQLRDGVFDGVRAAFDEASRDGHGDDDLAAVYTAFR